MTCPKCDSEDYVKSGFMSVSNGINGKSASVISHNLTSRSQAQD